MVEEPYELGRTSLSKLASVLCIPFHASVDQPSPFSLQMGKENCSASVMFRDHVRKDWIVSFFF